MRSSDRASPDSLRRAWAEVLAGEPGLRIRDAAGRLGVGEAELLATRVGAGVRRIRVDLARLLPRIEQLGEVMALTRNDAFVHEKVGRYRNVHVSGHVAQVLDEDIDLRIFPARWRHGFAVERETPSRSPGLSLQFFDGQGRAVHKIHLREGSDVAAYEALVEDFLLDEQRPTVEVEPSPAPEPAVSDEEVDVDALVAGWRGMRDTHDFFDLLREHGVRRTQALRLVPDELARPASARAIRTVLETASAEAIELMVFVQSPGTFQIHHGPVHRIVDSDEWLNVLDPGFNLHLREDRIETSWVVRKPTEAGWVTSVEFYDDAGRLLALVFGCRSEGEPENPAWRALAEGLDRT